MKYIISAGGTGGHIYPALSIINKIKENDKEAEILYIGTTDRMEKDLVPNLGIDYYGIKISGLSRNIKKCLNFLNGTIIGTRKCKKIMKKFKPDIVIGAGGYVTFPVALAAHKLKIKVMLHEQNSIPGKANRFLSKYADTICISMESSRKYFEHKNIVLTGNPRGEDILLSKKGNKKDYGLSQTKKLVLITMGSLGAETINKKMLELKDDFKDKNYEVLLVTGKGNYEEFLGYKLPKNVKIVPYIENMGEVLKFTDLIITRAGATIISEITALGLPSIMIPSPYVSNNHQVINAKDLEKNGASIVIQENELTKEVIIEKIDEILNNKDLYKKMSSSAKDLGFKDSKERIYNEIERLIKGWFLLEELINIIKTLNLGDIKENVSFKTLTTYKTGGTARLVVLPNSVQSLIKILEYIKNNKIKFKIFGNGSNILASDDYFDGVIIKLTKLNNYEIKGKKVSAEAGVSFPMLCTCTYKLGLSGLEFGGGIPGTVGGVVYMNAGAYLSDISEVLEKVDILDENLNKKTIKKEDLNFSYRNSTFMKKNWIILKAYFNLEQDNKEEILALVSDRKNRRVASQPLEYPSAGSVFRNPKNKYAGEMIESCNLKGYTHGGAEISSKHANFIINKKDATSNDIYYLMKLVQEKVKEKYNIELYREQELFGFGEKNEK